ncbi:MAG TPA: YjgN family protein [Dongiaceae bacterium]|nr:YjgN family protein [Dongiaceae bacterium]
MSDQGGLVAAPAWSGADQPVQKLEYDGRIGSLYGIFIKNILLGLITLGIYRFWGKTNLRRYVWSHVSLQGQRFEYTGTGGELFIGFLIVFVFYILIFVALAIGVAVFGEGVARFSQFVLAILIFYLVFVAQYAAQNYRLTRTLWSGIRGGMTGSAWKYGFKGLLLSILNVLTLNLAVPWTTARLIEDRFNHSYFGNAKATLQFSAKPLYPSFLFGFVASVVGLGVLVFVLWTIAATSGIFDGVPDDLASERAQGTLFLLILVGYFAAAFILIFAFAPYVAAQFREIARNLQLAELRFSSEVTAGRYIGLWLGNMLWLVLTLGLGLPVVIQRSARFFANRIEIHGRVDAARLQQTTLDRPRFGEGLLEAFDPGFF